MGRKSIADIRREEILDAYEDCIRAYGYHQSSTHRIAEHGGFKQPLIAHYFGNKAGLVEALAERVENHYMSQLEEAVGEAVGMERLGRIMDYLFSPEFLGKGEKDRPLVELLAASKHDRMLQSRLIRMYNDFLSRGEREIQAVFPDAPEKLRRRVAYGVLSLAVGNDLLVSVGLEFANRTQARRAAETLINCLET